MALSCGAACCKWILFAFNFVFWVVGAVVLAVGIWAKVDPNMSHYVNVAGFGALISAAAVVLICVGAFIFITGFFGCCGAMKENGCMLLTYASILCFILVLQLVGGIIAIAFRGRLDESLKKNMENSLINQYSVDKAVTEAWDAMQQTMKCCGANKGVADWQDSKWKESHKNQTVPNSCCASQTPEGLKNCQMDAGKANVTSVSVYTTPCHDQLLNNLKSKATILIGVALGLVFVQVMVIVVACMLRRSINSQYQEV